MKKVVGLLVVMICLVVVTGCGGKKTLVCTKDVSSSGLNIQQNVNVEFKDSSTIGQMYYEFVIKLPDSYKSYIDTFYSQFKKQYENQYKDYKSIKVTTEKKGDSEIYVKVDFDFPSLTKSEKKSLGVDGTEDYDVNLKQLKEQGFSCK